ncbi:uncharacterized protein LOC132945255 [Metopolophium dirhodum]|uniref:uncharacterized protein LOC132945255 n=1 Tax=Metopolophium dirhodum TaxID=44670 RepID=UPI0029902C0D|nr:uncharacterized protein LOC132945255 [Metopolophium dirhodum]
MNRLSIILAIAFVSYSLGAPETISESQSGDKNHGLEHGSGQGLEKQDGFGDGNVNVDSSTSDPSQIGPFKGKPTSGGGNKKKTTTTKDPKDGTARTILRTGICAATCVSDSESSACMTCINRRL